MEGRGGRELSGSRLCSFFGADALRSAEGRAEMLAFFFVLRVSAGPWDLAQSDFLARLLEGLAEFQIGASLCADDALCAGDTAQ